MEDMFKCPNCDYDFGADPEDYSSHITYWGEEGFEDCTCPSCEHKFEVKETVTRTFEVREMPKEGEDAEA